MDFTTARGRQRLSPRLRLSPTTTVTVLATTDLATGLVTATVMDFTTARGRQRLSPRLRLSPTTTVTVSATTDLVTGLVTATVMDFTTERGKPRLSPRLRLSPGWWWLLRWTLPRTWLQDLRLWPWTLLRKEGS